MRLIKTIGFHNSLWGVGAGNFENMYNPNAQMGMEYQMDMGGLNMGFSSGFGMGGWGCFRPE